MLSQVADGVWVRQSEWVWSNAIVVRGEGGLLLVDPGIDGSDLNQLADDVDRLGIPVVAGFSTHPHWDHLLWHSRFGRGEEPDQLQRDTRSALHCHRLRPLSGLTGSLGTATGGVARHVAEP